MNISTTNATGYNQLNQPSSIKSVYTEKLTKEEVSDIKKEIEKNSRAFAFDATSVQGNIGSNNTSYDKFQSFLKDIGYDGKPIAQLSQDEAAKLVSEDGIFGIKQTSERIANFVIKGAGGDEKMLRAGREGMLQGFSEAEKMLGGSLPDISKKTIKAAIELVDKAMQDLGYSVLNQKA